MRPGTRGYTTAVWIALLTPPLAIVLVLAMERFENQVTAASAAAEVDDRYSQARKPPKAPQPRTFEVHRWPARASRPNRGRQLPRDKAPVRPR
ncbi:hypothetical protein GCM10029964_066740 [Kibdelosporangium lantanae]